MEINTVFISLRYDYKDSATIVVCRSANRDENSLDVYVVPKVGEKGVYVLSSGFVSYGLDVKGNIVGDEIPFKLDEIMLDHPDLYEKVETSKNLWIKDYRKDFKRLRAGHRRRNRK